MQTRAHAGGAERKITIGTSSIHILGNFDQHANVNEMDVARLAIKTTIGLMIVQGVLDVEN